MSKKGEKKVKSNKEISLKNQKRTVYGNVLIDGKRYPVVEWTIGEKLEVLRLQEFLEGEIEKEKKAKEYTDRGEAIPDEFKTDAFKLFKMNLDQVIMSCPTIESIMNDLTDTTLDAVRKGIGDIRTAYFDSE